MTQFMKTYLLGLREAHLVAKIQNQFGVRYTSSECNLQKVRRDKSECSATLRHGKRNNCIVEQEQEQEALNEGTDAAVPNDIESANWDYGEYVVEGKFWYYLFFFGTYLGDELGYSVFIPFWFWNVDAVAGRKIVLVWTCVMYIGQVIKDIIRWPRPQCPPVVRLQKKWSLEYGMPSTHAMVGVALPSAVLYFISNSYQFKLEYGLLIGIVWCILISFSRLYLGMHSILDVIVGITLSFFLLIPLLPLVEFLDSFIVKFQYSPLIIAGFGVLSIILYPTGPIWTPTRGDTAIIVGTCVGIQTGSWINCQLFNIDNLPPPISSIYTWNDAGMLAGRTLMGYAGIIVTFAACNCMTALIDFCLEKLNHSPIDGQTKRRVPLVDLTYKYATFCVAGFNVVYTLPALFEALNVARRDFYYQS